jgi:transcriptional regulator with XRE-family HTH domain
MSPSPPGGVLKELLEQRGRSQAEVGRHVGLTGAAISAWVTGATRHPDRSHVAAVDDYLEANGRLLQAYGFTPHGDMSEVEQLRQEVAALRDEMDALRQQLSTAPPAPDHAAPPPRPASQPPALAARPPRRSDP